MEMLLECKECGHQEIGDSNRALMVRIRMLNHLNRRHSDHVEAFTQAVSERAVASH